MKILTNSGYIDILEASIGDEVLYFDLVTGLPAYNEILGIEEMSAKSYPRTVNVIPAVLDENGEILEEEREEVNEANTNWYRINGKYDFFAMQSVWANMGVTNALSLKVGDVMYDDQDGDVIVETIETFIDEDKTWYRLTISGDHSYIADGITFHNASRYWVAGTGNWDASTTTHWGSASGTADNASVPTAADDVTFDTASSTANAAYTVTITATAACANFTMDGPSPTDVTKVTWAGSSALAISGSLNLSGGTAGITNSYTGNVTINKSTGTATINLNSVVWGSLLTMNGAGTFQLLSNFDTIKSGSGAIFILTGGGVFDANGKSVILSSNSGTQRISGTFTGTSSFYNLTRTMTGGTSKVLDTYFDGNIAVTNTLTIAGASATSRLLIYSSVIGTQRTITITGTTGNSYSNVDFKDINLYDAAGTVDLSTITGGSGDCGGNSGITFTTGANQFWYKASGAANNWSTVGNWYLGTGGSGGAGRVPLPQDTAILDDLSFGAAGMTLTQDMPRIPSTTFKGVDGVHPVANTPTFTTSTTASFFGDLLLTPNMTLTASTNGYIFEGRGHYYLESAGFTWAKSFSWNAPGGIVTLIDNFITTANLGAANGTFDARTNNANVTVNRCVNSASGNITINMGNGIWEINGTTGATQYYAWAPFVNSSGTNTLNCDGSTIKITDSSNTAAVFYGSGKTYNNVWFSRGASTGSITISGSNTFNIIKDDGAAAHSLLGTAGTTQTVNDFQVNGTAGNLITLNSTTTGIFNLVKSGGGKIQANYLNIQHCVATPANTWYAKDSTNNQGVATAGSGWTFGTFLNSDVGNFSETGIDIGFLTLRRLTATVGDFILTPLNARIHYNGWFRRAKPTTSWTNISELMNFLKINDTDYLLINSTDRLGISDSGFDAYSKISKPTTTYNKISKPL